MKSKRIAIEGLVITITPKPAKANGLNRIVVEIKNKDNTRRWLRYGPMSGWNWGAKVMFTEGRVVKPARKAEDFLGADDE